MSKRPLRIADIAKKAGVSPATVSRVLNNHPYVRDEIRQRVLKIIEETGYQPNLAARSLATQRTGILGFVIPRTVHTFFSDPYFARVTEGIAQACNAHDYTLSLFLFYTVEDERRMIPRLTRKGLVDGIIVQSTHLQDEVLMRVMDGEVPFLLAGRPVAPLNVSYIDVDNVAGGYQATVHLLQLGRKRVATIAGPLTTSAGIDRLEGYRKALRERGLPVDEQLIVEGDFTEMGGYYAMRRLLPLEPDAVFVASDGMAVGALRAIREVGKQVPRDIAIVGYDDLPIAQSTTPPLTTIRQPILRFGARAVEVLLDIIENGSTPPRRVVLGTELVVRASCGATI